MPPESPDKSNNQPDQINKENTSAVVAVPDAIPSIDELLVRLDRRDAHEMNQAPVRGVVSDYGQILAMALPPGWIESEEKFVSGVGTRSFRVFHPLEEPGVMLCFYYRGLRMNVSAGISFRKLLDRPAHQLTLQEIASVATVLREKSELAEFSLTEARTEDINTKRVLVIEGRYKRTGEAVLHMFVDSDGSGSAVQEIYFQAPSDQFANYQDKARAALHSIEWKLD